MCGSSVNLKSHLAIPFNQSYMRSHLATSFNWNLKKKCVVSLWRVTCPGKMMVSLYGWRTQEKWWWSHCMGDEPKKNDGLIVWVTNPKKWWSHCMGDEPKKNDGLIVWVTNPNGKNVKCGLIIMGDLPRWKIEKNVKWSRYNGWPTQVEDRKNAKWSRYNGWPTQVEDRKNVKWSHCYGWPTPNERCDVASVKNRTYLAKSWRDDRRRARKLGASW